MGVRLVSTASTTILGSPIVTNAETVIATSSLINLTLDFQQVLLVWRWSITTSAATISFQTRIRRGISTAGAQVNATDTMVPTAGSTNATGGCYVDTPGAVAGQQYSLSVQSVAASGNHVVTDVCLMVFAL